MTRLDQLLRGTRDLPRSGVMATLHRVVASRRKSSAAAERLPATPARPALRLPAGGEGAGETEIVGQLAETLGRVGFDVPRPDLLARRPPHRDVLVRAVEAASLELRRPRLRAGAQTGRRARRRRRVALEPQPAAAGPEPRDRDHVVDEVRERLRDAVPADLVERLVELVVVVVDRRVLALVEADVERHDRLVLERDLQVAVPGLLGIAELLERHEIVLVAVVVEELLGPLECEPRDDGRGEGDAARAFALGDQTLALRRAHRLRPEHLQRRRVPREDHLASVSTGRRASARLRR